MNPHSNSVEKKIRVFALDDHQIVLDGIEMAISKSKEIELIARSTDFHQAIDTVRKNKIDVAILDLQIPYSKHSPLAAVRDFHRFFPEIAIVIFSMFLDRSIITSLQKMNINAFLGKDFDPSELLLAISFAHQGLPFLRSGIGTPSGIPSISSPSNNTFPLVSRLTIRECEILQLLLNHNGNHTIGEKLHISYHTVRTHRRNIMEKLEVKDIHQLLKRFKAPNFGVMAQDQ